ncbi:SDR family NAD(P)-dependent oxidoreductase [Coralliovum pocilloporae]|uniref:SDR family NAD(P)-dependent oxidoreductase n=1 Tax=Coralliovum pocilloporae TaxID=3066369 RepID=UPI003307393D
MADLRVLITGASSGLGVDFARLYAEQRRNLVLVARRGDRLDDLRDELERKYGIKVLPIALDLIAPGALDQLEARLTEEGLTVDILVNNAGFGLRGPFHTLDRRRQLEMIQLNISVLTDLCHRFIPQMIERGDGGILNVASLAAFQPGPLLAIYYATKAYVLSFTEALHEELKPHGIRVSALCPGPVATEFAETADMTDTLLFKTALPSPPVVRQAIRALEKNRAFTIPGLHNWLLAFSGRFAPRFLVRKLARLFQA